MYNNNPRGLCVFLPCRAHHPVEQFCSRHAIRMLLTIDGLGETQTHKEIKQVIWKHMLVGTKPRVHFGSGSGGSGGGFVRVVKVMGKPLLRPLGRIHRQDRQKHH